MKIGVTGASGFLGRWLLKRLLKQGHEIKVLARETSQLPVFESSQVTVIKGDLATGSGIDDLCRGLDQVYHLAGLVKVVKGYADQMHTVNVEGSKRIAEACLQYGVKRLLHCSSINALAKPTTPEIPWDEKRPLVTDHKIDYNRTKALAEETVLGFVEKGLEVVIVNPTAVIGPGDYPPTLAGKNILDLARGKALATAGGGFNFVDVRDVAAGMQMAMSKGESGNRYILGGYYVTFKELAKSVSHIANKRTPFLHLPLWTLKGIAPLTQLGAWLTGKDPVLSFEMIDATFGGEALTHAKASTDLGYQVRPHRETLSDIVNWYRESGHL